MFVVVKAILKLKLLFTWTPRGGCNPKKPYPSLTFSRVGVGFFGFYWVFSGFFGFLKN